MTPDVLLVFGILAATIVLFVSDRLRLDLVAMLALLALLLTGILTPAEALAGFSDPIVLIIAGLFVVGSGLFQTGVADLLGHGLARIAGDNETRLIVVIMVAVALLSAFISSTGTVAVLLPAVVSLALSARINPAKLLIPLAYGALLGGMLTLIGTPPNIVVNNQLRSAGLEPFSFFAFTPVGMVMLVLSIGFMLAVGRRWLPDRARQIGATDSAAPAPTKRDLLTTYQLADNLFRVRVRRGSPFVGQTLAQTQLRTHYRVNVLEVHPSTAGTRRAHKRRATVNGAPRPVAADTQLNLDDVLYVNGRADDVTRLAQEQVLGIVPNTANGDDLLSGELGVVEALLTPRSRLIGRTLSDTYFRSTYGVTVLAILRGGQPVEGLTAQTELRFGDTLLAQGTWEQIARLREERDQFVVIGQQRALTASHYDARRGPLAVAIMLGMLVLITLSIVPTVTAVLVAAVAMVLSRCITIEDVYRTMNWESVVLIAGMLPMATALEKTGGIQLIAAALTSSLGGIGPLAMMAGLFLLTSVFSQFISNTATTVLMAPIAIQAAAALDLSPYSLLMAVAVAASTAFATPIASPVNTLVLGPGGYRFSDFARVGVPLQVLLLIASLVVIPLLFPF